MARVKTFEVRGIGRLAEWYPSIGWVFGMTVAHRLVCVYVHGLMVSVVPTTISVPPHGVALAREGRRRISPRKLEPWGDTIDRALKRARDRIMAQTDATGVRVSTQGVVGRALGYRGPGPGPRIPVISNRPPDALATEKIDGARMVGPRFQDPTPEAAAPITAEVYGASALGLAWSGLRRDACQLGEVIGCDGIPDEQRAREKRLKISAVQYTREALRGMGLSASRVRALDDLEQKLRNE